MPNLPNEKPLPFTTWSYINHGFNRFVETGLFFFQLLPGSALFFSLTTVHLALVCGFVGIGRIFMPPSGRRALLVHLYFFSVNRVEIIVEECPFNF
jgi:hypothetical protein